MKIKLNTTKLNEIVTSFYEMTGIRIVIFDTECNEILSYPPQMCKFCCLVRNSSELNELCIKSDLNAFDNCLKSDEITIYKCHAGLVEAIMPIRYEKKL